MKAETFLRLLAVLALTLTANSAAASQAGPDKTIPVPGGLRSFDISWFDADVNAYFLADRTNKGIDIITGDEFTFDRIVGEGRFAFRGAVTKPDGTADNDHSGPDGIVFVPALQQLWAGDGDSTVKVIDFSSGVPMFVDSISTGGTARADELAFDGDDNVFLVANDADDPPFVTFISGDDHSILGKILFPDATNGLEQPVYDSDTGLFYLSVPQVGPNPADGEIAVIDPGSMMRLPGFHVDKCQPAGLALGPDNHLLVGCSQDAIAAGFPPQTLVLDAVTGDTIATIHQVGGSDEVWFNPGDDHYYLAARGNPGGPVLGVIDADTNTWIENDRTSANAHSVAANPLNNHVFVPLTPNMTFPGCAAGCIGIYLFPQGNPDPDP